MLEAMFILLGSITSVCDPEPREKFLPGIVSTTDTHEGLDWISEDGNSLLFTRALPDFSASSLMQATKMDDGWTVETVSISGNGFDAGLSIAPSSKRALFTSTRETVDGTVGNWNLWQAEAVLHGQTWKFDNPELMPEPVNTEHSECCVVYGEARDFFFASDRRGSWDIYHAVPENDGFSVSVLAGEINTDDGAWPSAYIPNAKRLVFSSIRDTGAGGDDIYVSTMVDGSWSPGTLLGAGINRSGYEDGARVFGPAFYWSSRPKSGENAGDLSVSNIYTMPTTCIDELR